MASIVFGSLFLSSMHAQPGAKNPSPSSLTTNWLGCLVVGEKDTVDAISPGPHPKSIEHVQLGLRSDGVVVWRSSPDLK